MKKLILISLVLLIMTARALAGPALTKENPISIDKTDKSVSFLAKVNGKYLYQGTRHFAVYEKGKFGDKGVFIGLVPNLEFYDALMAIKAVPGENMTLNNKETTHVKGQAFKVTITWEGADRTYTIDEVINESNKKPIVMKFGGNFENSKNKKTGCLLCLDSCPVGIVSNSTYTYGAVEKRKEVTFKGNKDLLPGDGTEVIITLTAV